MSNENNTADLRESSLLIHPKSKKNFGFPKCYPFPIVHDSGDENAPWNCIIGHLKEHSVEISEEKDIELLFTQLLCPWSQIWKNVEVIFEENDIMIDIDGFFGKGTLSRSTPQFLEKKFRERGNLSKSTKDSEQNNFLSLSVDAKDKGESNPAKRRKKDEVEVVLSDTSESSDSSDEDTLLIESLTDGDTSSVTDVVSVTKSKDNEKETLQLSLEEAFFLSYGLGVLVVKDKDQPLDLMRLWHKFCEIHPNKNFPIMYTAYHHFRSKGWIVKSGLKYGCDFVLYKDGPPFYHSSYAVIVKPVKEKNFRDMQSGGRPNLTWSSLAAVHRICSHACKEVMILHVIKPASISENKISTPFCVSQYQVEEVLVNRWVPSEEQRFDN